MASYYKVEMYQSGYGWRNFYYYPGGKVEQGSTTIGSAQDLKSALALMESKVPGKVTDTRITNPS